MPSHPRRLAVATAILGTAGVIALTGPVRPTTAAPVVQPAGPSIAPARVVGSPSCAAASCHGGDGPKGAAGSEYGTVTAADPHRRAFAVLFQERSERMVRSLAGGAAHAPAHRTAACLACHGAAPPNPAEPLEPTDEAHRSASCENCHGAAERYLSVHYTAGWKALSAADKAGFGLVPTKRLADRAKICAGCHVGGPGREVDHRLIAAGHPALRFELAAYQAEPLYPRHWRETTLGPDAEAWEWLIGQAATARAAADLLRHRAAEASERKRDWPELAEYACFACHQGLAPAAGGGVRSDRTNAPKAGQLPWGSWAYPLTLRLAGQPTAGWLSPSERPTGLVALAALFRETDRPPPARTRDAATAAVADLDRWLTDLQSAADRRSASHPLTPAELRAALRHVARFADDVPTTDAPSTDWDRYVQGFLGAAALYRALVRVDSSARAPGLEADLRTLAAELRFRRGQDGPQWTADDRARHKAAWAALAARLDSGERP
ncbi:MAG: multiheme c-type cytochrome [Gemmataceae bacterium]